MHSSQLVPSQFGQTPAGAQNINMVGTSMFQLPTWAKDPNNMVGPEPASSSASGGSIRNLVCFL